MLIDLGGAAEGDGDMAVRREERDQRQQAADDEGDPALDVEEPNPTQTEHSPLTKQYTSTYKCGYARSGVPKAKNSKRLARVWVRRQALVGAEAWM